MLSEVVSLKRRISMGMMPSNDVLYVPVRPPSLQRMLIVSSPEPLSSRSLTSRGRSFQGLSSGTLKDCDSDSIIRNVQPPCFSSACVHGSTAPPRMDLLTSGTIRSASISGRVPRPLHSWHMPSGLLNEKLCGASSGKLMPSTGHERCSEYIE